MIACHSLISWTASVPPTVATLPLSMVPGGGSRSGVSLRGSSSASTFDCERLPLLVLGHQRQLALGVLRNGRENHAEIQRAGEAIQTLVLAGDVDRTIAAVEVSQFDGRHDVELRARRVVAESHAGGAREILAGVGRVIHEQELEQMLQFPAGEVGGHQRAAGRRIHDTRAQRRHGEHIIDGLYA